MKKLMVPFVLVMCLTACVRLVGSYDEVFDKQITSYHEKTDKFLLTMARKSKTPDGTYMKNVVFYDDIRGDISGMQIRAESQTNNEITVAQVKNLDLYIVELENLHKLKADQGLTPKEVAQLRQSNQQAIGVILALEIAKKRGDK